jgi:hypothetical protein
MKREGRLKTKAIFSFSFPLQSSSALRAKLLPCFSEGGLAMELRGQFCRPQERSQMEFGKGRQIQEGNLAAKDHKERKKETLRLTRL